MHVAALCAAGSVSAVLRSVTKYLTLITLGKTRFFEGFYSNREVKHVRD